MRVGLFFGSFNPIHVGHLILAETFLNEAGVNQVWLVVSPQNPLKQKQTLLNEYDRYRLCELATQGNSYIFPTNVEFLLPRPSYTIDTLRHLAQHYPSYRFSLLMGEDNLVSLPRWKEYTELLSNYPIYVYPRLQAERSSLSHPNLQWLQAPILEISATRVRQLIKAHKSVQFLVPPAALAYIHTHHLYGN